MGFSPEEIAHFEQGPFPGRIDPWVEDKRYFKPIHSGMISALLSQLSYTSLQMGFVVSSPISLQMVDGLNLGVRLLGDVCEAQAIHITDIETRTLVTVLEIILPQIKSKVEFIKQYSERRARLLEQEVNMVELDPTRSVKRLTNNSETAAFAYHVAVFIPGETLRIIGIPFEVPLGRLAVPLRGTVIPVELHDAYTRAYRQTTTAWHIEHEGRYREDDLPFPSSLTDDQRHESLKAVERWQQELARLRT